eukprot:TRINITY_DN1055_c0_g2_i1.p2 TRINITY_DN1055_c0_g2~~TRINITY_DN1055_c0_g2_i1.p2  ORF type:complete len:236 (+),score=63.77 TRINITY_DN1055_c0_g2_i1:338-1045(+)
MFARSLTRCVTPRATTVAARRTAGVVRVSMPTLHRTYASIAVPRIGEPAPDFSAKALVNGEFKDIKLSDYAGKYLVLFFYPLDFTFVCPTEIIAFSEKAEEFRKIGAEVVGVSIDSLFTHKAWTSTPQKSGGLGKINIPLIADVNKSLSESYGALFLETGFSLRSLYIIGPNGNLRHVTMNEPPVGRNPDEVLRLVQAFQFHDKHGEVCPAGWRPGQDTINTADSNKYFSKHGKE